jgi:hypothetical protein
MLKMNEIIDNNERKLTFMSDRPNVFTASELKEFAERLEDCAGKILAVKDVMESRKIPHVEIKAVAAYTRLVKELKRVSQSAMDGLDNARWPAAAAKTKKKAPVTAGNDSPKKRP